MFSWLKPHVHDMKLQYTDKERYIEKRVYACNCGHIERETINLPPPLTPAQFIAKYKRNYINYAALIEVAFGLGDEMFEEYGRLTHEEMRVIVEYAKKYAANA